MFQKTGLYSLAFAALFALGLPAAFADEELSVAAAANLQYALPELNKAFETENPGVKVKAVFGSSGNFTSQIMNKAPFDVFVSADTSYPQKVVDAGLARKETLKVYAVGKLALFVPESSKIDLDKQGVKAVLDPSVKKISIASPKLAPYGRAAEAALKAAGVYDEVKDKIVLGESIAQAAQYVQSGSADIGFIAESLSYGSNMKGRKWSVPQESYPPIDQALVVLNDAKNPDLALKYAQFIAGEKGAKILKGFGFGIPAAEGK